MDKNYFFIVVFMMCTVVQAQYSINFDSFTLGDVSTQSTHIIKWPASGATDPQVTTTQAHSTPNSMLVRAQAGSIADDVIFQLGNKTTGTWIVKFWMYVPTGNNGYFNIQQNESALPTQFNGEYYVGNSTSGTAGFVTQEPLGTTAAYPSDTWFEVVLTVDLDLGKISVTVDGAYLLQNVPYENTNGIPATQFGGIDFYSADANTTFYIDDFEFYRICYAPGNLIVGNVTATSADISWDVSNETNGYSWVTMADGDDPLTGTPVQSGTTATGVTNVTVTGLTYLTDYDFYILSDCGAQGMSSYGAKLDFQTGPQCVVSGAVVTFPYVEGFEDSSPTLGCWTQLQEVGAASWTFAEGSSAGTVVTAHTGSQNARFVSLNDVGAPITKLISPMMDLTGLANPEVTFYYAQEDWFGAHNELKVYYRGSSTDAWVELASYSNSVNTWAQATVLLPSPTATYQIAFEGINNFGHANVLDDIVVQEHLSVASSVFQDFTFYPNPVKDDGLWLDARLPMDQIEIYDVSGKNVFSKTITGSQSFIQLSSLQAGVYFMKVKMNGESKVYKVLKQ